jgi:hypothetical protein
VSVINKIGNKSTKKNSIKKLSKWILEKKDAKKYDFFASQSGMMNYTFINILIQMQD